MRTCEGCGAEVGQTDITQRDADGNTWHCVCSDNALTKVKKMQAVVETTRGLLSTVMLARLMTGRFSGKSQFVNHINGLKEALAAYDEGKDD